MALFGRGNDQASIVKQLETRAYRGKGEKMTLLRALAEQGQLATDVLVRFVTSGDSDLHRFAADQLANVRDERAADKLLDALLRAPRGRWKPLIVALQRIGSHRLPERLARLLGDKRPEARAVALEVYAGLADWKDHLHLAKLALRDEEDAIRVRAVRILGQGAEDAVVRPLLCELMYSTDETTRHVAIEMLAKSPGLDIIEDFFDLLADQPPKLQEIMIRGLRRLLAASQGRVSDRVLERMLPLLAADDERIRKAAAQLLAAMPDTIHVLRSFLQYAKGIAFWLRDRAFGAVQTVADDIVEAILTLLDDPDVDVIQGAVVMAANSRDPRLFDALVALLDREFDWWLKVPALETIATFDNTRVRDVLVSKLHDEDLGPAAIACLGVRAEADSLPHLVAFLDHDRRGLRRAALTALAHYREPSLAAALERVARGDEDEDCRVMALEMLGKYGAEGVAAAAAIREEQARLQTGTGEAVTLTMKRDDPLD